MFLTVFEAFTGSTHELECGATTTVEALCAALSTLCGLDPREQMLLSAGSRLEAGRILGDYGLPSADGSSRLFLYARCV